MPKLFSYIKKHSPYFSQDKSEVATEQNRALGLKSPAMVAVAYKEQYVAAFCYEENFLVWQCDQIMAQLHLKLGRNIQRNVGKKNG